MAGAEFVHLRNQEGVVVAQQDNEPALGRYPTPAWKPGTTVRDAYTLQLPAELSPGLYELVVGMYRWPSLNRLGITENGTPRGDEIHLADVSIGK